MTREALRTMKFRESRIRYQGSIKKTERAGAVTVATLNPSRGVLGYSNAIVAGDMIRRKMVRLEEFESMQGTPILHVKNGKPLTAQGAKMLGVEWPLKQ